MRGYSTFGFKTAIHGTQLLKRGWSALKIGEITIHLLG